MKKHTLYRKLDHITPQNIVNYFEGIRERKVKRKNTFHSCITGIMTSQIKPETLKNFLSFLNLDTAGGGHKARENGTLISYAPFSFFCLYINCIFPDKTVTDFYYLTSLLNRPC